jgi:RNA recognition motif-containing protein
LLLPNQETELHVSRYADDDCRRCFVLLLLLLCSCGEVLECQIVRDRHTHESKGFGFVRMASQEGADAALQRLDNYLIGAATCLAVSMPAIYCCALRQFGVECKQRN